MNVFVVKGGKNYTNFLPDATLVKKMDTADVIIFTDGPDVNPMLYGARCEPTTMYDGSRDISDMAVFNNIPKDKLVIGFGRGAQFLTVMNGGKLIQECRWRDASNISHDLFVETKDGIFVYPKIQRHHQALYPWYTKHRVIAYSTNIKYYSERNGEIDYHLNYNKGNPEIVVYDNPEKPKCIAVQFLPTVYEEELLNYPLRVLAELINENTCR